MAFRGAVLAMVCMWPIGACTPNPGIDGSKVAPITNPDCTQACHRLMDLCGYAPMGDGCTTDAGDGYCDTQFDSDHLACVGQAASCQSAWECANAVPYDAGDESTPGDAGDESSADGPTE